MTGGIPPSDSEIVLDAPWAFVPADLKTPPLKLGLLGFAHMFAWNVEPGIPWRLQPNLPRLCHAGAYIRTVAIPASWTGSRVILRLPGVAHHAVVFVDGVEAGATTSPWTPTELDLSAHTVPGRDHELRIDVVDRDWYRTEEGWAGPPGLTVDILTGELPDRGLVFERPTLAARPAVDVTDVRFRPAFEKLELAVTVSLQNFGAAPYTAPISLAVEPWAGAEAHARPVAAVATEAQSVTLEPGASTDVSWTLPWPKDEALWWWPNQTRDPGYRTSLFVLTPLLDATPRASVRFGFCDVRQAGSKYLLNGRPLNLCGDNPTIDGAAATPTSCLALIDGAIAAGLNVIRPHAQPAPAHLYDLADERGLCLIPETGIYASLGVLDTRDHTRFVAHVRELVRRDRNHPCVVKYSVLNEGHEADLDRDFVLALHEAAQAEDPTRPVSVDESGGRDYGPPIVDIQHYSEDPDGPYKPGHPKRYLAPTRTDRPYGQGEFLFGADGQDHPLGLVRQGLHIRARRLNGEADIRPHTVQKHLAYDMTDGSSDERVSLRPVEGSPDDAALRFFRRSVGAVVAWDLDFDDQNALPKPKGELSPAAVDGADGFRRRIAVLNDAVVCGEELQLCWRVSGHEGSCDLRVPVGTSALVDLDLPDLEVGIHTLELTLAIDGQVRFRSDEVQLAVSGTGTGKGRGA